MKKLGCFILVVGIILSLSVSAFAKDVSLAELIGVSADEAKSVHIQYDGEVYEINVNDFYSAIDGIVLTDVEDIPLETRDGEQVTFPDGMYITVNGFDGYAFISDDCKVDKNGPHLSRLPIGAYEIKIEDRGKISGLFKEVENSDGDAQIILNNLFVFILPIVIGLILGICLLKIKKTYIASGILLVVCGALWCILPNIYTHGSEGPLLSLVMSTLATGAFALVDAIKLIVRKIRG